jgi:hypothetical protein
MISHCHFKWPMDSAGTVENAPDTLWPFLHSRGGAFPTSSLETLRVSTEPTGPSSSTDRQAFLERRSSNAYLQRVTVVKRR